MWQLVYKNESRSLAEWGVVDFNRTAWNLGQDQLSLKVASEGFERIFSVGEEISLYKNKVRFFQGVVTRVPCFAKANQQFVSYEVQGPFWYLQNLVYEQSWLQKKNFQGNFGPALEPVRKSRVVLGQNAEGKALSAAEQVMEILSYARQCGGRFEVAPFEWDYPLPLDECRDLSCAEALSRVLRWAPDMVMFVEYEVVGLPKIHLLRQKNQIPLVLDVEGGAMKKLEITPRHDLQVPSVILKYETISRLGEGVWSQTEVERYPIDAPLGQMKSVVLTLELEGARMLSLEQLIEVEAIEPANPLWWQTQVPSLRSIPKEAIEVKFFERKGFLPNALIKGTIADWMTCRAEEDTIIGHLSYKALNGSHIEEPVTLQLLTTDSESKTYTSLYGLEEAEVPPRGLAKALWEGLSILYHEGLVVLVGNEKIENAYLGHKLFLKNGLGEWENMNAVVQSVHYALGLEEVTVRFGPAKHLGLDQLSEVFRTNRRRGDRVKAMQRASGQKGRSERLVQPKYTRFHNTERGAGNWKRLVLKYDDEPKITLDASELPPKLEMSLREENVCKNGELLKRFVLATDPF